jgi:hypothetical protein
LAISVLLLLLFFCQRKKERGTRQGIKSLYRKVVLLRRFKFRIDLKTGPPARHFVSRSQVFVCVCGPAANEHLAVSAASRNDVSLSLWILTRRPKIRNLRRRLRSRTFQTHMVP